jgi:hypothetical protein
MPSITFFVHFKQQSKERTECFIVGRGKKMSTLMVDCLFPKDEVDDKKKTKREKDNNKERERKKTTRRTYTNMDGENDLNGTESNNVTNFMCVQRERDDGECVEMIVTSSRMVFVR